MKLYTYNGRCNIAGDRIQQQRKHCMLSQEQLAAKLQLLGMEISQKSISRIETGMRVIPDYELPFYAQALDTTVDWLLGLQ